MIGRNDSEKMIDRWKERGKEGEKEGRTEEKYFLKILKWKKDEK
jgi:hypothetical protein